jgi:hypothetical protein
MAEDIGTEGDAGGLDTTISNDMFAGTDIAETMSDAFDSQQESDQPRGGDGKFTSKNPAVPLSGEAEATPTETTSDGENPAGEETTEEVAEGAESESQEGTKPIRDVPIGWDKTDTEEWNTLSEKAQDQFLKRDKQYATKIQQSAEGKQFADTIKQVEAPFQAMIQAEGANTVTAYQNYLKTAYTLRTGSPEQKAQVLNDLARTFNVPVQGGGNAPAGQEDDIYVDPDIQALQQTIAAQNQRIAQMENGVAQREQSAQQDEIQSIDQDIDSFAKAEGHEHFSEVRLLMGALMTGGQAGDMDEAYEMAINAHPKIRVKAQATAKKQADAARTKEAQDDADRAQKTAGTNLKSKGSGKRVPVGKTMDQSMDEAYEKAMNR